MPSLENILKVVDAFRRLDRVYLKFLSVVAYPGTFHSISDICRVSGLPRSTVVDVLEFLRSLGVVERKHFSRVSYRLKVWEFPVGDVTVEVEVDRVVAYPRKS